MILERKWKAYIDEPLYSFFKTLCLHEENKIITLTNKEIGIITGYKSRRIQTFLNQLKEIEFISISIERRNKRKITILDFEEAIKKNSQMIISEWNKLAKIKSMETATNEKTEQLITKAIIKTGKNKIAYSINSYLTLLNKKVCPTIYKMPNFLNGGYKKFTYDSLKNNKEYSKHVLEEWQFNYFRDLDV